MNGTLFFLSKRWCYSLGWPADCGFPALRAVGFRCSEISAGGGPPPPGPHAAKYFKPYGHISAQLLRCSQSISGPGIYEESWCCSLGWPAYCASPALRSWWNSEFLRFLSELRGWVGGGGGSPPPSASRSARPACLGQLGMPKT